MVSSVFWIGYWSDDIRRTNMVKSRTAAIKALMKRTAQDIIEIGQQLIEVKEKIGHGNFRGWLKEEFGWEKSTANNFINVALNFKCSNLEQLSFAPSALYLLSSPSVPEEVREEAISLAESGEKVTHKVAKELIEKKASPRLIYDLTLLLLDSPG